VLDLQMPGLDGIAVAQALAESLPDCGCVIVTSHGRPGYLKRALSSGVRGFLPKTTSATTLAEVVRRVHAGGRHVDPELAAEAIGAGDSPLTPREADVLEFAADGAPVEEIARRASLSPGTVRNYLSSAISKLGATIYNTTCYFGPDGSLLAKHRKQMPTGSERTVWGMGDGSTLPVVDTPFGRLSGLTCWENYMPLARFYLYHQGVDIWVAPTLASGDGWIAAKRHVALEGRCYVIGVNPCLHVDQIPADFPHRDRVWRREPGTNEWVEPGNTVIVSPTGKILAGPARHEETILTAEIDLATVHSARRYFDPVGHYHRPDIFQLVVDTRPRPAVRAADPDPAT
jgi:predicted amidohydrolase